MEDTVKESRELAEVFRTIADLMERFTERGRYDGNECPPVAGAVPCRDFSSKDRAVQ